MNETLTYLLYHNTDTINFIGYFLYMYTMIFQGFVEKNLAPTAILSFL